MNYLKIDLNKLKYWIRKQELEIENVLKNNFDI